MGRCAKSEIFMTEQEKEYIKLRVTEYNKLKTAKERVLYLAKYPDIFEVYLDNDETIVWANETELNSITTEGLWNSNGVRELLRSFGVNAEKV